LKQAAEKYVQALKIKPDKHEALNNWGSMLSEQAKTKSGAEADALFRQAGEKYEQALKIKPDKHEALNNWGGMLSEQALKIKPDKHEALNNWGGMLSEQAKTKSGAEAETLFRQAGEKYEQALKIKPDKHEALYNLACLFALQNTPDRAVLWLRRWRKCKPGANRCEVDADHDFDRIRDRPVLIAFLEELSPGT
jgi:Tfp pilus assembly protein PilF